MKERMQSGVITALPQLMPYHQRKVENTRRKAERVTNERFYFDYARTEVQRKQAFALRYRVFCLEREFLAHQLYPDKQQRDAFDVFESTKQCIGFYPEPSWDICGTMRIIRDPKNKKFLSERASLPVAQKKVLPIESQYSLKPFRDQSHNIEQVTSLAFTRGASEQIYFGLCKCVYLDAIHHGIDDIFIQANPLLAWLFEAIGFKQLYATCHPISMKKDSIVHKELPVIGMHLDMKKITDEFRKYFALPDPHFLFQRA